MDSDLDLCQPDQSSRCPSREEAPEPIGALHPTASEICRCAATLEEDPRSAPPPPGPGSRRLRSLRPQPDANLIKSPHAGRAAPPGSGEGLLALTRRLLLFVSRGVFEQDVEDGYHQHLPDICHGETPPSAGRADFHCRRSPAGSFLLSLKREMKDEFASRTTDSNTCVSFADVLATTRRQNTALDSAYGQWTSCLHSPRFPRAGGSLVARGDALIHDLKRLL